VTAAQAAQLLSEKPVSGWYVCRDLGIGSVPGLPDLRQRIQLCHNEGWTINTYCTQPGLPAPPLGKSCTRIGKEKYSCGANNQIVREYITLSTPVDTATPVDTSTPNATQTQTITPPPATATATPSMTPPPATATQNQPPRPPVGGEGNTVQVRNLVFTEISILVLAMCMGFWFFRRLKKWD
jgi:hypothetical protein